MEIFCRICGKLLENSHPYKVHHIKLSDYFLQYYAKKDLLTEEPIPFKSIDQYLLSDFCNKTNQKKWLLSKSTEVQKMYLQQILIRRRTHKNLTYTPTQVEQRSADGMVGIKYYNNLYGNFYELCEKMGFKSRGFKNINQNTILKPERSLKGNPILIDSREQSYLNFGNKEIQISTLPIGDYTVLKNNCGMFVERKSVNDLISTFGPKNYERFKKELARTQELGYYLVLLVEADINTVLNFEYSSHYNKHTQMTAVYLFHQIRTLLQEFNCWQIAFCKGRTDMKDTILKIFEMKDFWKRADLQLAIDYGLLSDAL